MFTFDPQEPAYSFPKIDLRYDFSNPDLTVVRCKMVFELNQDTTNTEALVPDLSGIEPLLVLYGFNIDKQNIQVFLNDQLLTPEQYSVIDDITTGKKYLQVLNAGASGCIEVINSLNLKINAIGLFDDNEETVLANFRDYDLGLSALVFSPDPVRNLATYVTQVILPEVGPYSNPEVLCVNGIEESTKTLDDDGVMVTAGNSKVYIDNIPKPSTALTFFMSNKFVLATGPGNKRHVLKWQTNEQSINLNIYLKKKYFDQNPNCNLAIDILRSVLLWNENNYGIVLPYLDFNIIGTENGYLGILGSNSNINFLPSEFLIADTLTTSDKYLHQLVDLLSHSVLMHGLADQSINCDLIGVLKHYEFSLQTVGPVFEVNYAQKFRNAIKSNKLTLEQKYLSLAFTLCKEWEIEGLRAAIQLHLERSPYDYYFPAVLESFKQYHKSQHDENLDILDTFSDKAEIPHLMISSGYAKGNKTCYEINFQLPHPKKEGKQPTTYNILGFSYWLLDKNGKQIVPRQVSLLLEYPETITIEDIQAPREPILLLQMNHLLANVIDPPTIIDERKIALFKSNDLPTKSYAWDLIKSYIITTLKNQEQRKESLHVPEIFLDLYAHLLESNIDLSVKALLMKLPTKPHEILQHYDQSNITSIMKVLAVLNTTVASKFADKFKKILEEHEVQFDKKLLFNQDMVARRAMQNACLSMLMFVPNEQNVSYCLDQISLPIENLEGHGCYFASMETMSFVAELLLTRDYPNKDSIAAKVLQSFYERAACVPKNSFSLNILFKMYGMCNSSAAFKHFQQMRQLQGKDGLLLFDINNEVHVRCFLISYLQNILLHSLDGRGYDLLKLYIIELDNLQKTELAIEFMRDFAVWCSVDPNDNTGNTRKNYIIKALQDIARVSPRCALEANSLRGLQPLMAARFNEAKRMDKSLRKGLAPKQVMLPGIPLAKSKQKI